MEEKVLGKIVSAKFGNDEDMPFLFGLQLCFQLCTGQYITCGGRYIKNISEKCRWSEEERRETFMKNCEFVHNLLEAAKCNFVHELVGKPVEVTIENRSFKNFRILTEVL